MHELKNVDVILGDHIMLFDACSHILSKGENDTIRTPIRAQNPRQQDLELLVYISVFPLLIYFCKLNFSSILNLH